MRPALSIMLLHITIWPDWAGRTWSHSGKSALVPEPHKNFVSQWPMICIAKTSLVILIQCSRFHFRPSQSVQGVLHHSRDILTQLIIWLPGRFIWIQHSFLFIVYFAVDFTRSNVYLSFHSLLPVAQVFCLLLRLFWYFFFLMLHLISDEAFGISSFAISLLKIFDEEYQVGFFLQLPSWDRYMMTWVYV